MTNFIYNIHKGDLFFSYLFGKKVVQIILRAVEELKFQDTSWVREPLWKESRCGLQWSESWLSSIHCNSSNSIKDRPNFLTVAAQQFLRPPLPLYLSAVRFLRFPWVLSICPHATLLARLVRPLVSCPLPTPDVPSGGCLVFFWSTTWPTIAAAPSPDRLEALVTCRFLSTVGSTISGTSR